MKVSGMCSILGINVNLNPILEAAGGHKASLEIAGIVHSEFLVSQGRFYESFRHVFHTRNKKYFFQFLGFTFYNKARVLIRQQYIFEM